MSMNDRYAAVMMQCLCYWCLGKGHAIKDCKVNACGIIGWIKKQSQLLHSENQMDEGSHAVNVSAATINQGKEVTSFLQIVPLSIQSGCNRLTTYALLDSRSTVSRHTRDKGSEDRKGSSQKKGTTFKCAFNRSVCTPINILGKHKLQLQQAEAKLQSLECFTQQKLQPNGSWNLSWSRCLWATTPTRLQDRNKMWSFRRSIRARMGSQWTHDGQKKTKCLSFRLHRGFESGWEYPNLVVYRNGCIPNHCRQSVNEGAAGTKMLESTPRFTCERYEVGMLWREPEPNLPNNYSSALGQLCSLERRFQRDSNLKRLYQQPKDTDVETAFVKILEESKVKSTFGKEWYLPHHPVVNLNKPGKVRLVCNAASKYKEVCLNDKLHAGPDLLHGLIGTIFRFREGPIALTADIKSMFLQVQVPE